MFGAALLSGLSEDDLTRLDNARPMHCNFVRRGARDRCRATRAAGAG